MRSNLINTEYLDDREYILMSNIRTELDIIPSDYVLEYTSKIDDVSSLKIEIPKYIVRGDKKFLYPTYDKIQGKQFIVVKKNNIPIERFVINSVNEQITKDNSIKTIEAESYETVLKNKTCLINEGMTRQLYKPVNETLDVEDGILNVFEQQTGWKVTHCDELCRKEMAEANISVTLDLIGADNFLNISNETILLDIDVNIPSEPNFSLNFDIAWKDIITDGVVLSADDNGEEKTLVTDIGEDLGTVTVALAEIKSIIHTFVDVPQGVKHIKAMYTNTVQERYGLTYVLTLEDDSELTKEYAFVNAMGMSLEHSGISLTYITSKTEQRNVTKYRFLEHQSSYWYQYLKTTIQDAFNCYIFFDSYNKTISVYDKISRGEWKGFYLDFDNLLTKINKTPKIEDICTRLWVQSSHVDIIEFNPLGTSYVENYDYFKNNGSMSDSLANALDRYYVLVEQLNVEWNKLKEDKNATDQLLTKRNSELVSLNSQIKTQNALLTAYIKANSKPNQERVAKVIAELESKLANLNQAITELTEKSNDLLEKMQDIGKALEKTNATDNIGRIFTQLDLDELEDFTIEQTYTDDVRLKAKDLYEYSKELIDEKSRLTYSFSLEHGDLVKGIKHPLGWQWYIELGGKVEINDKDIADPDGFVIIYAYTYSPKNKTITNVDFNNNSKVVEAESGLASIGKLVHQTASMTDYWKSTWIESENANIVVSDIRKNGLDLAANIVRGGSIVNKISMSEAGLFVIDANDENNQIYIGASLVALTDDKWIHSKTAIDTGGVIADTIVGRLLLGENLIISNEDNSFQILPNGLTVRDKNGIEKIEMGINIGTKNPYFNLGTKDDKNYLIFKEDGTLDIKASSINFTVGGDYEGLKEIIGEHVAPNRNYALDTLNEVTVAGNGTDPLIVHLYDLSEVGSTFFFKEITLSFVWQLYGNGGSPSFYIRTGSTHNQKLSDTINASIIDNNGKHHRINTILDGDEFYDLELVVTGLAINQRLEISLLKLEEGKEYTAWSAAPEDAKVYTDEQIKLLRKYDIQDLINLNNSTMNKITAILEDGTITPNEKVQLYAEFKRIKIMYEDIIGLYATVNDSTLEGSLNEMIYYYQQLVNILTPILVDMDVDSSASSSQVREAFNTFYDFYYELLTAIQKAVAVQGQYNYTQLNMLDEKISMTATTVEAYNGKIDEFSSHFDFSQEGFVQIYASHNGVKGDFETQITDQKLAFKEKGEEVAYISNQEMFITKATVTDQMQIGSFIIKPSGTANGGVIFVHEDDL